MGVRREGGDPIDIQGREIDDVSHCSGPGESDDLAGEISYNSDGGRLDLRISIKQVPEGLERRRRSTGDAGTGVGGRERFVISREIWVALLRGEGRTT
jgi:hypothetical protein